MKRIWMTTVVASVMALGGCGSSDSTAASFEGGATNAGAPSDAASGRGSSSGSAAAPGEASGGDSASAGTSANVGAGVLTAGVWDDNLNFDFFKKYLEISEPTLSGIPSFTLSERDAARQKWAQRTAATELDLAFLIDTTGSMGDELTYLQSEIDGIAQTIKAKFPQTTPRYGLVLYKDAGDAYVTRPFNFTTLEDFRTNLAQQTVGGGGDYPEAVAAGLDQINQLSWRPGAVARMTFWVADAPHHVGEEASVKASITSAAAAGVHIYPVAASGTDPRAELTMRTAAQLTGGRYVFLTDDSGVGNAHAEPHIPCYHVTKFNGALVRMVESEMSGSHVQPKPEEILRTVGDPQNGVCATKSSGNVTIY